MKGAGIFMIIYGNLTENFTVFTENKATAHLKTVLILNTVLILMP